MSILKKSRRAATRRDHKYPYSTPAKTWAARPVLNAVDEGPPRKLALPKNPRGLWDVYYLPFRLEDGMNTYVLDDGGNPAFDFRGFGNPDGLGVRGHGRLVHNTEVGERMRAIENRARRILGDLFDSPFHSIEERQRAVQLLNEKWYELD